MPPHGGYGMNSGVIDAFDLAWRLAALHKAYGGTLLLQSYNLERRPMMIRALERSLRHLLEHIKLAAMNAQHSSLLEADTPEGEDVRRQIGQFIDDSGPDTTDLGIELDLRYAETSPVIYQDDDGSREHEWDVKRYIPSTRPGCRAPHVFLKDGVTSTYDLFGGGPEWTLVLFVNDDNNNDSIIDRQHASGIFLSVAKPLNFPLKLATLHNEPHAQHILEYRDLVLVRPDTHIAWRGYVHSIGDAADIERVLRVVSGHFPSPGFVASTAAAKGEDIDMRFRELVSGFTDMHRGSSSSSTTIRDE